MKILNTHTGNTFDFKDEIAKKLLSGQYKNQFVQVGGEVKQTNIQPVGGKKAGKE